MKSSRILTLLPAIIFLAGWSAVACAQEVKLKEIVVDDFSTDNCSFTVGAEFPGAKGSKSLSKAEFKSAPSAMCIDYDLTGGGRYVGIEKQMNISAKVKDVSFLAKITSNNRLCLRLTDNTGQTHQSQFVPLDKSDTWQKMVFAFNKRTFSQHWGGAKGSKKGEINFPVKSLTICVQLIDKDRAGQKGKLYIDDIAIQVAVADGSSAETYTQAVEIEFRDEDAAKKAIVQMAPLYNDYEWAVSARWDDNFEDAGFIVRDLMKKYGCKGTFYLNSWIGPWSGEDFRETGREFMKGGNSIGNHTLSHPMITVCNRNRIFEEMARNRAEWEAITDSQVLSYAFSYNRAGYWGETAFIKDKGEVIKPDIAILLKRAGLYSLANNWFVEFEEIIPAPFMPYDGADIDGFVEKTLKNEKFKADHPIFMFAMHAWAYNKGQKQKKLEGQLEKYGNNPNWWYCNLNEYAAYRYQYKYSKLMPLQRDGKIVHFSLKRPVLLDLNNSTPLTFKITQVPAQDVVAVKCATAESVRSDRQKNGYNFHLQHNRDQELPRKIGLIANDDNRSAIYTDQDSDFPGLRGVLSFKDNMLHLALNNQTGLPLTKTRITYRLPLAWDEGVVRRSIEDLKPGSKYQDDLYLIPSSKDYKYTAGEDYFVAQVDFRLGDEPGRLHLSCHMAAPPRDTSYPQEGFARLGPLGKDKLDIDNLVAALGNNDKATDALNALAKQAELKWQSEDTPLMPPFLSPQMIRTTGRWQNWGVPRPQFWVLWSLLESDKEQDVEFVFVSPNDRLFVNGIEAVKDGNVKLLKGRNVVVLINKEYNHHEFCPGSFLRVLKPGTAERITNIRFQQPAEN
ncbi:MAG: hypothetical protein DRP56_04230 [Planctomycetota bacterium]|nr:MAG: hypothetical protein DRP56_04230 [Planctomycetota bacterium]